MDSKNLIDKPLMSNIQWGSLCFGLVVATNFVSLVLADIDRGRVQQNYQEELHKKDIEIIMHKMSARDKRNSSNFDAIWTELNNLKESHE